MVPRTLVAPLWLALVRSNLVAAPPTNQSVADQRRALQNAVGNNDYANSDPITTATWRNSALLSGEVHDESEITPEDYLWQNLPGRCCFSGHWDNKRKDLKSGGPLWVSIKDCGSCDIWGQPDASCHNGPTECAGCGMELYCEGKPPALLGGARVCTGQSRIGEVSEASVKRVGPLLVCPMHDCACSSASCASARWRTRGDRTHVHMRPAYVRAHDLRTCMVHVARGGCNHVLRR